MVVRGQGAMEYLMTYGWAILVVMVVGVAMWQLGIFNMGGGSAPTAKGFSVMKPILTTCMIGHPVYSDDPSMDGFVCEFINPVSSVEMKDINITIDGNSCIRNWIYLSEYPDKVAAPFSSVHHKVIPSQPPDCVNFGNNPINCTNTSGTGPKLPIPKDKVFSVAAENGENDLGNPNMCDNLVAGQKYSVYVDITYDEPIGEIKARKHDSGTIYLTAQNR
jgi:hypothetical protein